MTDLPLTPLHQEFMGYSRFTRQVSPHTLRGYHDAFDLLLKRYPDMTTSMISPETLITFFQWLQTRQRVVGRGALRQGVKKSTIATYWRKLSKFFSWLVFKRLIPDNPLQNKALEFRASATTIENTLSAKTSNAYCVPYPQLFAGKIISYVQGT